jgi:hypothetical protein
MARATVKIMTLVVLINFSLEWSSSPATASTDPRE